MTLPDPLLILVSTQPFLRWIQNLSSLRAVVRSSDVFAISRDVYVAGVPGPYPQALRSLLWGYPGTRICKNS